MPSSTQRGTQIGQGGARELIEKCTFLHEGEDENVSDYTELIADAYAYGHGNKVYWII